MTGDIKMGVFDIDGSDLDINAGTGFYSTSGAVTGGLVATTTTVDLFDSGTGISTFLKLEALDNAYSANRTLSIDLSNQDKTLTFSNSVAGIVTVSNWFNQSVKTTASPTFAGLTLSGITLGSVLFAGTSGVISQDNAKLFWDNSAKRLGIGTATPGAGLEIQSSSPILRLRDTGATADATAAFVEFGGTDVGAWVRTGYVGDASSGDTDIYLQAEISDLHLGDSSSNSVLNLQNGNVGIGLTTVNANYKLIIRRAADINLGIGLQSSELAIAAFNDALSANIPMRFYASEYNLLNGNVGINVTDPDAKLEVVGTLHVSDAATFDSTIGSGAITSTAGIIAGVDGFQTGELAMRNDIISNDDIIQIKPSGDNDDFLVLSTVAMVVQIGVDDDEDLLQLRSGLLTVNGQIGVGKTAATDRLVDAVSGLDRNIFIQIETTNTDGLNAAAAFRTVADNVTMNFQSHGPARTIQRFGETLADWAEFLSVGASSNGLIIGTGPAKPFILGTGSTRALKIDGSNQDVLIGLDDTDNTTISASGDITQVGTGRTHESEKFKLTAIGGYAIKLTNKTGANSVAGNLVKADTATDDAVILTAATDDECFGVFLDAGITDGSEAWVVIAGIADVLFDDNVTAVRGNWNGTGQAGLARTQTSPPALGIAAHFEEIGHSIENVTAGGGGTFILARCVLHFN